jgi:hypothetical protein
MLASASYLLGDLKLDLASIIPELFTCSISTSNLPQIPGYMESETFRLTATELDKLEFYLSYSNSPEFLKKKLKGSNTIVMLTDKELQLVESTALEPLEEI